MIRFQWSRYRVSPFHSEDGLGFLLATLRGPARTLRGRRIGLVLLNPAVVLMALSFREQWIRLFDFYSGKCLAKVAGHSELATGVRFTPDGRRLITTGGGAHELLETFARRNSR